MSAWLVRDSLIDFKEVTVHWTHGNAVVNHTLCVFRWLIFQLPRSPISCPYLGRYRCPAPDINRDLNVSSVKTDFRYKRSFLSIAGAKVQQFGIENKFWGYRFLWGVCKCLTDSALQRYFGNQLLHLDWFWRKWRLVTQNFRKAVIWSWSCSVKIVFGSARSSYNINNYLYYIIDHFDRFKFHFDRKWLWPNDRILFSS